MFCIQTFLIEYDIITSYMEDLLALKCIAITELLELIHSDICEFEGHLTHGGN